MPRSREGVAAFPRALATNPYCELLSDALARAGADVVDGSWRLAFLLGARRRVGVLHLHWPERHYRRDRLTSALGFVLRLLVARALGYRLVWTVHNAAPHEGSTAGSRLVQATLLRVARPVVHCETARRGLGRAAPRAIVIPHGSYRGRYAHTVDAATARARPGLAPEARVLLAFGQVRAYKGLGALLAAFAALDARHARLIVAGEPVGPVTDLGAAADRRVQLILRRIPDDEVQLLMNAADVVVLPYRAVLTSGAAMLAFSFDRGIVAPRLGCLLELERTGAAILYDPDAPNGLAGALERALAVDPARLGIAAGRVARRHSWDAIARRHLGAYGLAPAVRLLRPSRRMAPSAGTHARPPGERSERWT